MNNIDALSKLKRQILKAINLKVSGSPVLNDDEKNSIRKKLENYSNLFTDVLENYNNFYARYSHKQELDLNKFKESSKKLEEYHIDAIKNLTSIHDDQITKSNEKISVLQTMLKNSLHDFNSNYNTTKKKLERTIPNIDYALEENKKYFNSFYDEYIKIYAEVISKTNTNSDILIEKIHSDNSRRTIFLDEEDDLKRIEINKEIQALEDKIKNLEDELKVKQERLKSKMLAESVELNKQIKILTDNKNRSLQLEKDKNQIKINDLKIQLANQQNDFNGKSKKTISLFVNRLAELDQIDSKISLEYNQNIDDIKRNYFYSYYSTLQELNSYISQEKSNNKLEAYSLKRANKKLYKLRIKSYKEKIRNLKNDYESELLAYEEKYNIDIKKLSVERELAEINKNHEIEIANLELETKKANIKLLNDFVNKQEYLRNIKINDNFNREASNKRVVSLKNVEHLQRRIDYMTTRYTINIQSVKAKVLALNNDLDKLNSLQDLRHIKNEDKYNTSSKLIRIITMLELDKNKLLNDFNKAQINHKINLATIISLKQKKLNESKLDYLNTAKDIKENMETIHFQLDANKYRYKIDTHNWYKKYGIQNETNQFSRKKDLLDLKEERRQFRFNCLHATELAKSYFNVLGASIKFGNSILEVLKAKVMAFDAPTTTLAVKLIEYLGEFQRSLFTEFSDLENQLVEAKIEEITQYKYTDNLNQNRDNYNERTQEINNNIKLLVETINRYRNTKALYQENYDHNHKILKEMRKNNSSFNLLFSKDYLSLKRENKELKSKIHEITNREYDADNNILYNRNLTSKLEKKYRNNIKAIEKSKKKDYKSYFDLILRAAKIKNKLTKKMDKLYSSTTIDGGALLNKNAYRIYEYSSKYMIKAFTKYELIFNHFKASNEEDFIYYYHKIINQFKERNKALNLEKTKRFKLLDTKTKAKEKILLGNLKELNNKIAILKQNNKRQIQAIEASNNRYYTEENSTFNKIEEKFHDESSAVTNNISYLRNKANTYIEELEDKFASNYNDLVIEHKNKNKEIFKEHNMYKLNKENYLANILQNEKKGIAEIENNGKDEIKKINLVQEENRKASQILKKKYKKEKIKIITTNTNKLLQSRILHNKTVKLLSKEKE